MKIRALLTFFSVLILFGCQKDTQTLDLGIKTLSSLDDEEGATALSQIYESQLSDGSAVLNNNNVITFFNQRLSQETLRDLETEILARESLLNSEDYYLCVNEYLPGYDEAPEEVVSGGGTQLPRTLVPVTVLEESEGAWRVEHRDAAGNRHIYWRIGYDYMAVPYWGKKGIIYADGRVRNFIAQYKDCPSIQDDIFEEYIASVEVEAEEAQAEAESNGAVTLPGQSSGFMEYVCTEDDPLRAYDSPEDVENDNRSERAPRGIPRGMQVVRVQGEDSEPFVAERNDVRYIRVQVQPNSERADTDEMENQRFWVGEPLIKQFEDCAFIQTEVVNVCSEEPVSYYLNSANLSEGQPSGSVGAFELVYRRYGEAFSKRVLLNSENEEIVYVPVSRERNGEEILWIDESKLPLECPLNPEIAHRFRSSQGLTCTVIANDNFPLEHASRIDYRTDNAAKWEAARSRGRKHPATDLYSFYRNSSQSRDDFGGNVRAINRSKVKRISNWANRVQYAIVQSRVTRRSWVYGEVGRLRVRDEQALQRNHLMGVTAQIVTSRSQALYPAMLHLEFWNDVLLSGRSHYRATGVIGSERDDNPTCYVEYMSMRKFNKIWEGE